MKLKNIKSKYFNFNDLPAKLKKWHTKLKELDENHLINTKVAKWLKLKILNAQKFTSEAKKHHYLQLYNKQLKNNVLASVSWFKGHKKAMDINNQNIDYIIELLASDISTTEIAKGTNVPQPLISNLRNSKRKISRISLITANKLINYYKKHKNWYSRIDLIKLCSKYNNGQVGFSDKNNGNLTIFGNTFKIKINAKKHEVHHTGEIYGKSQQLLKACQAYANLPNNLQDISDANFMSDDIYYKENQVLKLWSNEYNRKEISKKLKMNHYFINKLLEKEGQA